MTKRAHLLKRFLKADFGSWRDVSQKWDIFEKHPIFVDPACYESCLSLVNSVQ
jgi:hypothetical protein